MTPTEETALMLLTPAYHVGLVVEDMQQAQAELTQTLGLTWAATQRRVVSLEYEGARQEVEACFAYSLQGPPYLELIEQRPGTVYGQIGLHHLGLWTDDSRAESQQVIDDGSPLESAVLSPDGVPVAGFYHRISNDLRIELVDAGRSGPRLVRYLRGGNYA